MRTTLNNVEVEWAEQDGKLRRTFGKILSHGEYEICPLLTRIFLIARHFSIRKVMVGGLFAIFHHAWFYNYVIGCKKKNNFILNTVIGTSDLQCDTLWQAFLYTLSDSFSTVTSNFISKFLDELSWPNWFFIVSLSHISVLVIPLLIILLFLFKFIRI
jgi:hypothetical protein